MCEASIKVTSIKIIAQPGQKNTKHRREAADEKDRRKSEYDQHQAQRKKHPATAHGQAAGTSTAR